MTGVSARAGTLAALAAVSLVAAAGTAAGAPAPGDLVKGSLAAGPVHPVHGGAPGPVADGGTRPGIQPGTQPVYDYAGAIRESIDVDTELDTDSDGRPDTIAVDIVRPRETAEAGVRVPVIMDASPYYKCCGRGNESEKKTYDAAGVIAKMPLFYDNYFVPRGYAVVAVDVVGTSRSTGCGDVGGKHEIASVVAVIDWLNGRNTARARDGSPVRAGWTTGAVGMIGKSYDGTLANGVAATGVPGLKTIVPISAISSWYDYSRSGGVPYRLNYMAGLGGRVGHDTPACAAVRADLSERDADETGDYTEFWAERDHVKDARKIRASVFVVHGLSDYNVQPNHFGQWWKALGDNRVPRKIWLGVEEHVDPFEFRRAEWVATLHRWFDYWLMGLANGVMREPMATVETAPDVWRQYPTWPQPGAPVAVPLAAGKLGVGGRGSVTVTDEPGLTEDAVVATPSDEIAGRQMFLSGPLPHPIRISGTPSVTLRIRSDKPTTPVTARLLEYGAAARYAGIETTPAESCWGASTPADDACYREVRKAITVSDHGVVGRGWIDAAHSGSLSDPKPLTPGRWTTVKVPLRAQDLVIPRGRILGLAVTLSDTEWSSPNDTGASIDIDLAGSRLELPLAGGRIVAPSNQQRLEVEITTPTRRPDLLIPVG